jgi:hypothetical protein
MRNLGRDQLTAYIQSQSGFKPFVNVPDAIAEIVGRSDLYKEYVASGAPYGGAVTLSRPQLEQTYKRIVSDPTLLKKLNIVTKMEDVSQIIEQASRFAAYKAAREGGNSPLRAGVMSRESTVNFGRHGGAKVVQSANAAVAFLNAGIQGFDKTIRAMANDPVGVTTRALISVTIPSIIEYYINKDDPAYNDEPAYIKNLFWSFPAGDRRIHIPKPFLFGQIYGTIPTRFMEYLDKRDPKAFEGMIQSLVESASPFSGDMATGLLPTGLKPILENAVDKDFFRGSPIVPATKKNLPPAEQYGPYTSEVAKLVGGKLGVSPSKVEHLVTGLTAGSGRYALRGADALMKATGIKSGAIEGPKQKPKDVSDTPGISGLIARPLYALQSKTLDEFYTNRGKAESWQLAFRAAIKAGNSKKAKEIREKHPWMKNAAGFDAAANEINSKRKSMDIIASRSTMSDDEKKRRMNKLAQEIIDLARKWNGVMEGK